MAIPAKTMDEVLEELDRIIDLSVAENNYLSLFAYIYRRTTAQVKQAILEKQFEDNERMEILDVAFANLYLTAYQRYADNLNCSESWQVAFSAKDERITIMQHLMLGMNAHINFDLGVATASFGPVGSLLTLKNDFMKVNQVLNGLVNEMQDRVAKVSRFMLLLEWMGKNTDELIINFSMAKAREQAWGLACELADLKGSERQSVIGKKDHIIAIFGVLLKNPPGILLNLVLKLITRFEEKDVKTIIKKLRENQQ